MHKIRIENISDNNASDPYSVRPEAPAPKGRFYFLLSLILMVILMPFSVQASASGLLPPPQ